MSHGRLLDIGRVAGRHGCFIERVLTEDLTCRNALGEAKLRVADGVFLLDGYRECSRRAGWMGLKSHLGPGAVSSWQSFAISYVERWCRKVRAPRWVPPLACGLAGAVAVPPGRAWASPAETMEDKGDASSLPVVAPPGQAQAEAR